VKQKRDFERRAAARSLFDPDFSTEACHRFARNRKPKASAFSREITPPKRLEDVLSLSGPLQFLRRDL
jgi:hypothetical protein